MVHYTLFYVSLYVVSFNVTLYVTPTPIVPSLKHKGTTGGVVRFCGYSLNAMQFSTTSKCGSAGRDAQYCGAFL